MSTEDTARAIAQSVDTSLISGDLHTGHASMEQKLIAASSYLLEGGNAKKAAEIAGVHHNSVLDWKKQNWWQDLLVYLKKEHAEDFKARLGTLVNKTLDAVEDRIQNGDMIMNYKTGEIEHKPIGGKDAATIFGILWDKQRVMENQPTNITESTSETERLEKLKGWFEELAEKRATALEGEYTRHD